MLEDLIIWTNYEIEVAAYNGAGRGIYSHKVTEWTLQGGERHDGMGWKKNAPTRYNSHRWPANHMATTAPTGSLIY